MSEEFSITERPPKLLKTTGGSLKLEDLSSSEVEALISPLTTIRVSDLGMDSDAIWRVPIFKTPSSRR
jgi:hypothetical protein